MKTLQKILPSTASILLVLGITLGLRLTIFASDIDTDWYEDNSSLSTFTISEEADLRGLSKLVNEGESFLDKTILLTEHIELTEDFIPIGTESAPFCGTFDGNNNTISTKEDIVIGNSEEMYQGLFGYAENASFQNITLNATVVGKQIVGGLVGCLDATDTNRSSIITNCSILGTVTATSKEESTVGGLIGYISTNRNCSVVVEKSHNAATISSEGMVVGGLIGNMYASRNTTVKLDLCYNTGDIEGDIMVGGLVGGNMDGAITNCYNTGNVKGSTQVGGLVGVHLYATNNIPTLETSYNIGAVHGNTQVGGIIGYNSEGTLENCYYNNKTSGESVSSGIGAEKSATADGVVDMSLSTLEMTGVGTNRADEKMVGLSSSIWLFTADTSGTRYYPTLLGNTQSPAPHNTYRTSGTSTYYIQVHATDGGVVSPDGGADHMQEVKRGKDIDFTIQPDKGYVISDVLVNGKSVGKVKSCEFTNVLSHQTLEIIFAKEVESTFDESNGADETEEQNTKETTAILPFSDITTDDENFVGIAYVYEKGIMAGLSPDVFGKNASITRGMIAAILYRMDGSVTVGDELPFADVEASKYYTDAVRWGKVSGVMSGMNDTHFSPNTSIRVEQFVAFLYRYADYLGMDMTLSENLDLSGYVVSDYARNAIAWALEKNILDATDLEPKSIALRGDVATTLMHFMELCEQ